MAYDRRISRRFALQVPITLVLSETGLKVRGKTRDISSGGVFFYANLPVTEHQEVELLMTLPYKFSLVLLRVACRARVLRVEPDVAGGSTGMAVAIQGFDFLETDQCFDHALEEMIDPT